LLCSKSNNLLEVKSKKEKNIPAPEFDATLSQEAGVLVEKKQMPWWS
jgi:hypothetical protein